MKILVIYGGYGLSPEAEVSERSGNSVLEWFRATNHEVESFLLSADNLSGLKGAIIGFDMVLPILHGHYGESGEVQKILEAANIPFWGSDSQASELCWDKQVYKKILEKEGVLVPEGGEINAWEEIDLLPLPFVLKANKGGSSIGVWIVKTDEECKALVREEVEKHGNLIWEEVIEGNEITVGILGSEVLPVVEIVPPYTEWFDYENKYNGRTKELLPSENVGEQDQKAAQGVSLKIHKLLGCRDVSRTDLIMSNGQVYVLETNTMPGMTDESLLPKMILASGRTFSDFTSEIVEMTLAHG